MEREKRRLRAPFFYGLSTACRLLDVDRQGVGHLLAAAGGGAHLIDLDQVLSGRGQGGLPLLVHIAGTQRLSLTRDCSRSEDIEVGVAAAADLDRHGLARLGHQGVVDGVVTGEVAFHLGAVGSLGKLHRYRSDLVGGLHPGGHGDGQQGGLDCSFHRCTS